MFTTGQKRFLKTAAIFGPNASGKSNLIHAMHWMGVFVRISSKDTRIGESLPVEPFRLSTLTETIPSHFEVEVVIEEMIYRYGFTVSTKGVESECLFRQSPTAKKITKLLTREGQDFSISPANFREGRDLNERTRNNALVLSVCAQWNGPVAKSLLAWFDQFRCISGVSDDAYFGFTAERLQKPGQQEHLLALARQADFSIRSLRSELEPSEEPPSFVGQSIKTETGTKRNSVLLASIRTIHAKVDENGMPVGEVEFDLREESQGTQKFVALSGPISYTLQTGSILVLDELEASLHPKLTLAIVDVFHSPLNNRNAQLICATHDVTLLEPDRFRRDQVWFCEKNADGATDLYSLAEFDSNQVRPTSKFSRQYLLGLFGALPKLAHFEEAVEHAIQQ